MDPTPIIEGVEQEFSFTIPITGYVLRSIPEGASPEQNEYNLPPGEWMMVEGGASDTSEDKLKGTVSERALIGMVNCVNHGTYAPVYRSVETARRAATGPTVGIDVGHSPEWTDQIGFAVKADAIYDLTPEMVARGAKPPVMVTLDAIDLGMSHGKDLKRALDKGIKLGKSIYGAVVEGKREVGRSGELIRERFDLINLKRIAYTSAPVNNVTWVRSVARSFNGTFEDVLVEENNLETEETQEAPVVDVPVEEAPVEAPVAEAAPAEEVPETTPAAPVEEAPPVETPEAAPAPIEVTTTPEPVEAISPEGTGTEVVVPAPDAAPDADGEGNVARAIGVMQEYFIGVERFTAFEAGMKGLLAQTLELPNEIARAHNEVTNLRSEMSDALKLIDAQKVLIEKLTERVEGFGKQGQGRQGIIARSYNEVYEGNDDQWTPAERRDIAKKLSERGDVGAAMNVIMGTVKKADVVKPE